MDWYGILSGTGLANSLMGGGLFMDAGLEATAR